MKAKTPWQPEATHGENQHILGSILNEDDLALYSAPYAIFDVFEHTTS
jgi:hypothetical protein